MDWSVKKSAYLPRTGVSWP